MEILFGIAGIAFYAWEYYAMNKYWYSKRNYIVFDSGKFFARKLFISIFIGWIFIIIQILEVLYHWLCRIIEKQPGSVKKQKKRKRNAKPQNIQKSKDMPIYNLNNSISRSKKHNEMGNVHVVDFNAPNRTKSNYKSSLRRFFRGIFLIIRWSLFMFLAIMTLGCFLTSIISGIVMLVSATLMCPAVNKLIKSKLPTWLQMALSLFIFCIAAVLLA